MSSSAGGQDQPGPHPAAQVLTGAADASVVHLENFFLGLHHQAVVNPHLCSGGAAAAQLIRRQGGRTWGGVRG